MAVEVFVPIAARLLLAFDLFPSLLFMFGDYVVEFIKTKQQ